MVPSKAGTPRPTTLRDARQLSLVPSVTTIIKCAAAPALTNWMVDQGILAALTLPRNPDEAEAWWLERVKKDAQEQARAAAERGTEIHAAIEAHYAGYGSPEHAALVGAVDDAICGRFGMELDWYAEPAFAHPLGFGGKADLLSHPTTNDVLLDVKTKDAWAEGTKLHWDEHAIQLAAYRHGLGRPEATCANVFVSRQEPWQVSIHTWDEADLQRGWRMFLGLLDYWKAKAGYESGWQEDEDAIPF